MAIYYNLAIDCDQNEDLAKKIAAKYHGFSISTEQYGDIVCDSEHIYPKCYWGYPHKPSDAGDWHIVCISPRVGKHSETDKSMAIIRDALYQHLADPVNELTGYRSALYGCEAQDYLGDEDWLGDLNQLNESAVLSRPQHGLIVAQSLVTNDALRKQLEPFSSGYLWFNRPMTN